MILPEPANTRLFINAVSPDGVRRDLAVRDGRFCDIATVGRDDKIEVVDLHGLLVLPAFVDGHVHLDKSSSVIAGTHM
jgi:cytosine deaminase